MTFTTSATSGTASFQYTIADRKTTPAQTSKTGTVTFTIVAAPVAVDQSVALGQGDSKAISVLADATLDVAQGKYTVTVPTAATGTSERGGTVKVTGSGTSSQVTYTPPSASFTGSDSFTFTVTDQFGQASTKTVSVTVDTHPTADDAVADTEVATKVNVPISTSGTGTPLTITLGSITPAAAAGTAVLADAGKSVDFTPASGFTGVATIPYTVTDVHGHSATAKIAVTVLPSWVRLSGPDRYDTAVAVAKKGYPDGASTVLIATGHDFPDALAAGPVAVAKKAPLLLTEPGSIPASTLTEIKALHPSTIVIVGGSSAVSPAVANQLKGLSGVKTVDRVGGANRFETSRLLADYGFKSGATTAFVVTGTNFPDAVSVSAPAGAKRAPILLVNGSVATLDSATRAELTKLKVTKTYVAGGTAVVSQGVVKALPNATRLAGATRFETNLAVAKAFYPTRADTLYVATGADFPDALVGGVLAAQNQGPLVLVTKNAWPKGTLPYVKSLGFTTGYLLGGTNVLGETLKKLNTSF